MGAFKIATTVVLVGNKWEPLSTGGNIQEQRMALKGLYDLVGKGSTCVQMFDTTPRKGKRRFLNLPPTLAEIKEVYANGVKAGAKVTNERNAAAAKINDARIAAKQARAEAHKEASNPKAKAAAKKAKAEKKAKKQAGTKTGKDAAKVEKQTAKAKKKASK
jgi:hypothetical protein